MRWTAVGLALGLCASLGVARLIAGFPYGVSLAALAASLGITVVLAGTAFNACYVTARRASRIDRLAALGGE